MTAFVVAVDIGSEAFCHAAVHQARSALGGIDVLVNNAGEQPEVERIEDLSEAQLERTFRTNIYGMSS